MRPNFTLIFYFLIIVFNLKATVYTTTGTNTWDANGAPPAGWISNHTININHTISNMTAYTLQMNTGITVNVNSGGDWIIAGVQTADGTSSIDVNNGGRLELTSTLSWSQSSITVDAGGLLVTNGATTATGGTIVINGTFFIDGTWNNDIAITGSGNINHTGVKSGTGSFTGTESLPVELIFFDAKAESTGVNIKWTTASETQSDFYKIMKSTDGKSFYEIGQIPAAGFSSSLLNYEFHDDEVFTGKAYYQLIQYDFDGTKNPSEIITLDKNAPNDIITKTFPNPSIDGVNFNFFSENGGITTITS